jgi:hypothetical protein
MVPVARAIRLLYPPRELLVFAIGQFFVSACHHLAQESGDRLCHDFGGRA